jgi:hypothetical protein
MPRPSAKSSQLELIESGVMDVQVTPPYTELPEGIRSIWGKIEDRQHWMAQRAPLQTISVSYEVFKDPVQLADLEARANRNRSRNAVRGYARAERGMPARIDMNRQQVAGLVASAADNDTRRRVDGPVIVKVKRLAEPVPWKPHCYGCHRAAEDHARTEVQKQGGWHADTGAYDPNLTRTEVYWFCPEP